jgi:hypothetical protein
MLGYVANSRILRTQPGATKFPTPSGRPTLAARVSAEGPPLSWFLYSKLVNRLPSRYRRTPGVRQSSTLTVHDRIQGGPPLCSRSVPPRSKRGPGRFQPGWGPAI